MRLLSFLTVLILSALPMAAPCARAEDAKPASAQPEKMDHLFDRLKKAKSEALASDIANQIREKWNDSGSATVNLLMQWSADAMNRKDYAAALDFLDQAVVLRPDYAEGWNRRATTHYLMNNYSKAMADIEKALALEPRHFGALSGMAMIFADLGKTELALKALNKALDVYPMQRELQRQAGMMEDQITGSRI